MAVQYAVSLLFKRSHSASAAGEMRRAAIDTRRSAPVGLGPVLPSLPPAHLPPPGWPLGIRGWLGS